MTDETSLEHQSTAELHYPVEYDAFVAQHPEVLDIYQKVSDVNETRNLYENGQGPYEGLPTEWPKQSNVDGYLGAGHEKSAYAIGDEYVVKVQNVHPLNDKFITDPRKHILCLNRGLGVNGLEQLVTADPDKGILVTERAAGRPLPQIPSSELFRTISKDHIKKLEEVLKYMTDNLLEFDNAHNVLFDPVEGFTVIDYRTPLWLKREENYSANPDDDSYSPFYADYLENHSVGTALNRLLTSRKKYLKNVYTATGELEEYLKPTLGRRVVKSLVKLKSR